MWCFPKDGIQLFDSITLKYEPLDSFFGNSDSKEISIIDDSLINIVGIHKETFRNSVKLNAELRYKRVTNIQHSDATNSSLLKFYDSLVNLKSSGGKLRILHYGDSQIDGDRMTGYIRNELQKEFGGTGAGLLPAYQVTLTNAARQKKSKNWKRYISFGKKYSAFRQRKYGLLASFSRYCPPRKLTGNLAPLSAWLEIKPASYGYKRLRKFSEMSLYLGGNKEPVMVSIEADKNVIISDILKVNTLSRKIKACFKATPSLIKISFKGLDSPNVFGISLESKDGVIVDNISLRGGSGTFFLGINKAQLESQFAGESIRLVILQFGGNSVPYITTKEEAEKFGEKFRNNLNYLKSILPDTSFLVIGPSDMATKIKGKFVTYPLLETIRDHMQQAACAEGAAYYDMFEVMGGKNSMLEWIKAKPRLARRDYVHFTVKGAKKMAVSFYQALRKDYDKYLEKRTDKSNAVSIKK